MPLSVVNVPGDYFSMAAFEVTTYGRFWVSPEDLPLLRPPGSIHRLEDPVRTSWR
jgi:hypothetical protein